MSMIDWAKPLETFKGEPVILLMDDYFPYQMKMEADNG